MKRRFQGLASMSQPETEIPDGVYLVHVSQVRYMQKRQKSFYSAPATTWVGIGPQSRFNNSALIIRMRLERPSRDLQPHANRAVSCLPAPVPIPDT